MQRVGPWLFLLLGVTLTVGFYEGRRMVWNTMKAIEVVSADWRGEEEEPARRPRAEERRERRRASEEAPPEGRGGDRKQSTSREKRGKKASNPGREKLRERLKRAVQDLSAEERELLKEEVIARRAQRRAERGARREMLREGQSDPSEERPAAPWEEEEDEWDQDVDEEELLDALEDDFDDELLDTSEPTEP